MSNRASDRDTSFLARRGLVGEDFRAAAFADADFSATGFSSETLDRVRWPFALAEDVFFLGALGSAVLEVAAAVSDPLAASCVARASLRWRLLRWSLFSLGVIALSLSLSPRFNLPYDSMTSIMRLSILDQGAKLSVCLGRHVYCFELVHGRHSS